MYTGQPVRDRWHIDHTIPLSVNGTPGDVVTNLVPCNPGPNRWKGPRDWINSLADRAETAKASWPRTNQTEQFCVDNTQQSETDEIDAREYTQERS
ncbi:hypothetical protein A5645_11075 [Mycobacterium asiaticum]|nr:hypothetical protein A5645_11075 [Mycobacterium asiaticum]